MGTAGSADWCAGAVAGIFLGEPFIASPFVARGQGLLVAGDGRESQTRRLGGCFRCGVVESVAQGRALVAPDVRGVAGGERTADGRRPARMERAAAGWHTG